jgi:hypothetical protein
MLTQKRQKVQEHTYPELHAANGRAAAAARSSWQMAMKFMGLLLVMVM